MPVFRLFGVFFRVAVDPPVVPPPPPGVGFRLQVFWGDSANPPHLSTLITTKITFPCNLLEITGADFLYMEIARLYLSGFIRFYRVLSGFIGFYRVFSGFIGFYRGLSCLYS